MNCKNNKTIKYLFLTVLMLSFHEAYAIDPGRSFLCTSAHRFIKEQIHDHRLTPQDVADIEAISIQMKRPEPIVDEINRGESKVDITLRWDSKTKTYTLEQKDKEWADACRDFDWMFRDYPRSYVGNFECLSQENQNMIIRYFQTTGNTTDDVAMAKDLFEMDEAMITQAKLMHVEFLALMRK